MVRLSRDVLDELLETHSYPCISIYLPVSAAFPGEMGNVARYQNLLERAREELGAGYPAAQIQQLMGHCRDAVDGREFWNHRLSALAVFCSPDLLRVVDLPRTVPQAMVVGDSFHAKPLIRLLQTMDRYQVLCLSRGNVRLLEGDRDQLAEVPLVNVPPTIEAAFGEEVNAPAATRKLGAGTPHEIGARPAIGEPGIPTVERWFRIVDKAIWENHSRNSHLPMILCALPENQEAFRRVSKNQNLIDPGIPLDPNHVPLERIRQEAWKVMEPQYRERVRQAVNNFRAAKAHHCGDDDVLHVAKSAAAGKINLLLVEADRHVGGKLDPRSGEVLIGDIRDPMLGDLLDDTAETVLRSGGDVLVMSPDLMPTDTGIAAVYRF